MRVFNIFKRKQISENQTQCTQHHGPAYYEEQKVKDLEHVLTIESDGYNATTLYVHRLTNQPYIIHKTLEQYGAGCYDAYHKITLSTYKIINQMLANSKDSSLQKYVGINEENWKRYKEIIQRDIEELIENLK